MAEGFQHSWPKAQTPLLCAGAGQGVEHLFYYPEQAQENYVVNQYVNADAGAKGLAQIVKEISDTAIEVQHIWLDAQQVFYVPV